MSDKLLFLLLIVSLTQAPWNWASKTNFPDLSAAQEHQRAPRGCPKVRVARPEWLYGEWSTWSPCTKTCGGGGLQHRRRQCAETNPGCKTAETRPCGTRPCAPGWSEWCEWEGCRATCGVGERMRVRFCEGGTLRCPGKDFQITRCNTGTPCPGWWDWSSWSMCSSPCGLGVQHRERHCFDEHECHGNKTEARQCNQGPCSQYHHGRWTSWSSWTVCDRSCGGGTTSRQRTCYPRQEYCPGVDSETRRCNDFLCQSQYSHLLHRYHSPSSDRCVWTTWTNWSGCVPISDIDCRRDQARGQQIRQRYCVTNDVRADCGYNCEGGAQSAQERRSCTLDPQIDPCR